MGESFCQPVCDYLRGWNVLEIDSPSSYFVTNVLVLDVDVLCLSVIDRVLDKYNGPLVVIFQGERDGQICWSCY